MITSLATKLAGLFITAACACAACSSGEEHAQSVFDAATGIVDGGSGGARSDAQERCTLMAPCAFGGTLFENGVCPPGYDCYDWGSCEGHRSVCGCPVRDGGQFDASLCSGEDAGVL
jgi:hypothetical protein